MFNVHVHVSAYITFSVLQRRTSTRDSERARAESARARARDGRRSRPAPATTLVSIPLPQLYCSRGRSRQSLSRSGALLDMCAPGFASAAGHHPTEMPYSETLQRARAMDRVRFEMRALPTQCASGSDPMASRRVGTRRGPCTSHLRWLFHKR